MRPLILIVSCDRDRFNGRQQAAEETWVRRWEHLVAIRFVLGFGTMPPISSHELFVTAGDDYMSVPLKMQEARDWALDHQHDYVFQACVDTWINVPALLRSGFGYHDYIGYRCDEGHASGGAGYWLSARAMLALTNSDIHVGWDDLIVGQALAYHGIPLHVDSRYSPSAPRPPDFITAHLSKGIDKYDPSWMYACHEENK